MCCNAKLQPALHQTLNEHQSYRTTKCSLLLSCDQAPYVCLSPNTEHFFLRFSLQVFSQIGPPEQVNCLPRGKLALSVFPRTKPRNVRFEHWTSYLSLIIRWSTNWAASPLTKCSDSIMTNKNSQQAVSCYDSIHIFICSFMVFWQFRFTII